MSNGDAQQFAAPHLPTFGEILGHLVRILHLNQEVVSGRIYAPQLDLKGSVCKYLGGEPTPRCEEKVIRAFAGGLIASGLIPGLRVCLRRCTAARSIDFG